jgi:formylmethanofuran dehydrogenase subunit E
VLVNLTFNVLRLANRTTYQVHIMRDNSGKKIRDVKVTMPAMPMDLKPIGIIRSPYATMADAPHQGRFSDQESEIIIDEAYSTGLTDVEHHPHLIVLSWLDRAERNTLTAIPPHDPHHREHGVFATRSPHRPNPIGLCVVELIGRNGRTLRVRGLDALNGTPVLDIKPFSRGIDCVPGKRRGPVF